MPPKCKRCAATRLINLDTAQRIGVVSGGLVGGAIGALRATAATQTLSLATARFPLAKLPAAMIGAVTGGQSGVRITTSLFMQWLPPSPGTPWLCLACGHSFRQSHPPLAAVH
ncbi:hypothetical protein E0L35_16325 [Halomonas sp. ATBC28]|uniref:hypothetical protein n=1 Tax=Halomonas sp. ATBC28 TaxID=2545264 RepID=UPI00110F57D3|nr:hypothetical protein [Halomonas sp. ATBC28]TMU20388.1 hypothetical protein E0L35_16325 [Halomonas sp. ATBC28]